MKVLKRLIFLLPLLLLFTSCYYQQQRTQAWDTDPETQDSLDFATQHHYSVGYNFCVQASSLALCTEIPSRAQQLAIMPDSVYVGKDDELVVAQIDVVPEDEIDTVWVKVARDQMTQGWVRERELLTSVSPDDPISQAIYKFSGNHVWGTFLLIGLVLVTILMRYLWLSKRRAPHRVKLFHLSAGVGGVCSPYPWALCLTLSGAAVFYACMQLFVPYTWTEFYFHPTLNPFAVPALLGAFLFSVWLMLLFFIATIDDVFRQLPFGQAVFYLLMLITCLAILYLFFSLTTLIYLGYPLFVLLVIFAVRHYLRYISPRYHCGKCGRPMHNPGICPRCGTLNE